MLIMPAVSVLINGNAAHPSISWQLTGKWIIFWGMGVRLFVAGVRQVTKPAFTAQQIFRISSADSFPVIRELGFANMAMGTVAMISLFKPDWRLPAATAGCLYFGMAGLLHLLKKPASSNERIALLSDLYIFALMLIYCIAA